MAKMATKPHSPSARTTRKKTAQTHIVKEKKEEGAFLHRTPTFSDPQSDTEIAREYFRSVLQDRDASSTQKLNAASQLAAIEHRQGREDATAVSKMPRSVIQSEIRRMQAVLSPQVIEHASKV